MFLQAWQIKNQLSEIATQQGLPARLCPALDDALDSRLGLCRPYEYSFEGTPAEAQQASDANPGDPPIQYAE